MAQHGLNRRWMMDIAILSCMAGQTLGDATCYTLLGSVADPKNTPCVSNVTGTDGSHSACCNYVNGDACLASGLCLNTLSRQESHMFWSTGCTDPTFQDLSCPQLCFNQGFANAQLQFCNDTFVCCQDSNSPLSKDDCCASSTHLGNTVGRVVAQLLPESSSSPTPSGAPKETGTQNATCLTGPSDIPTRAIAGLAVEGVILALTLVALGFMIWRQRLLNHKLVTQNNELTEEKTLNEQLQQQGYYRQPPVEMATHGYGLPVESDARTKPSELGNLSDPPPRPELSGPSLQPSPSGATAGSPIEKSPLNEGTGSPTQPRLDAYE